MSVNKIATENVNHPGRTYMLDADAYAAMRRAMLKVLPDSAPGLTVAELRRRVLPHLSERLFPGGAKAGWWVKAVQLDLEAKRIVLREQCSPIRLHKAAH